MHLKHKVLHGIKWKAITLVGRQFISLGLMTVLARLVDPASFGLISLSAVYFTFANLFADQGIASALIQREKLKDEHLHTAFWFNFSCAAFLCLLTLILAHPIASLFKEPRLALVLQISSLGFIIGSISAVHGALLTRELDFHRAGLRTLLGNLTGGIVGIIMAYLDMGVWALVGQQLSSVFSSAIFVWIALPYRPKFVFSLARLKELFGVSSSVFATSILWFFSSRLDQLSIGRLFGVESLGLYVLAGKIPEFVKSAISQPVSAVALPALSRSQADLSKMRAAIYRGMELNALISFPAFLGLAALSGDIIPLFFGEKWRVGTGLYALLCFYQLCNNLQVFFHPALLASGGTGRYVILNVFHTLGVVISCCVGYFFGLYSLVGGLIINSIIIAIPALILLKHRIGLNPLTYLKTCLAPALVSIFMWLGTLIPEHIYAIPSHLALLVALKVAFGALFYFVGIGITAPDRIRYLASIFKGVIVARSLKGESVPT